MNRVLMQLMALPLRWFVPRGEMFVLALLSTLFWTAAIWQASTVQPNGASVFSLFGLGLLYLVFCILNLFGAIRTAVRQYLLREIPVTRVQSLVQLLAVLAGMFVANALVLVLYLVQQATFTPIDQICYILSACVILVVIFIYGITDLFSHPLARGWLAIAGKAVPQLVMTWLFFAQPTTAHGVALVTLLGINALALLRLLPAWKAYTQDRHNLHLRGLVLGEGGNMTSSFAMTIAWICAQFLVT